MPRRIDYILFSLLLFTVFSLVTMAQAPLLKASGAETDRDRDGLMGPVRRVRTEMAKLSNKTGKVIESPHLLLETVAYDVKGGKTENAYYPVSGAALTGKEVYKYDDKGNISEMTLLNSDGSLLSKESYAYDYDFVGNWTKMTTSVAIIDNGKLSFEPTEVTYRSISYYLDEATLAKMSQQQAAPAAVAQTTALAPATANSDKPSTPATSGNAAVNQKTAMNVPPPLGASMEKVNLNAATSSASSTPVNSTAVNNKPDVEPPSAPPRTNPVPKPLLKPVSGGVLNGSALSLPKPNYPDTARTVHAQGVVTVEVIIDVSGKVISARATSGHPLLQQAAVQAAYQAKFSPTTLSGQPVKVSGTINYSFAIAR
jgi:TonB family protein